MTLLLWVLLALPPAQAQSDDPRSGYAPLQSLETEQLLRDLRAGRPDTQLQAARDLRRLVQLWIKHLHFQDLTLSMAAQQSLSDFDKSLAPVCIDKLDEAHLTMVCADILRLLETTTAIPALNEVLVTAERRRVRKRLAHTVSVLSQIERRKEGQGTDL